MGEYIIERMKKMEGFLTALRNNKLENYYSDVDWYLQGHQFGNLWNVSAKKEMGCYIKQFPGVSANKYGDDKRENISFYQRGDYKFLKPPIVQFARGETKAQDWVRHIRNSIAHGNCFLIKNKDGFYLELLDYIKNKRLKRRTCLFPFPFYMIHESSIIRLNFV